METPTQSELHDKSDHRLIRTLLVDDSAVITDLLEVHLGETARFDIIGIARDGLEAVEKNAAQHPDLIIMDINMPRQNGLQAAEIIKQSDRPPRIILLTLHTGRSYRKRAAQIGVDGFCDKLEIDQQLIPTILAAFGEGGNSYPPNAAM